ncbi:MAG TPA: TetR/AcrR family transcriptional regulator [Steroidobacteraceae bacterium]|nr:TetR/AcrR family transcriptional regulator [Steroidobacteraceae bacterium]
MSRVPYIAVRREKEKERRRSEILDAAEALYAKKGWNALTVDQVARSARLSRALVYVYFRDKEDLLFAIGERAMRLLSNRFIAATAGTARGTDQVDAIGRAYLGYAYEFPHYFDFCVRFQSHSMDADPSTNEGACQVAGDQAIGAVVHAIETGIRDGSIRAEVEDPLLLALTLWASTHGIIRMAMAKGTALARRGVVIHDLTNYAFQFLREVTQCKSAG